MISRKNHKRGAVRALAVLPLTATLLAAFSLTARSADISGSDSASGTDGVTSSYMPDDFPATFARPDASDTLSVYRGTYTSAESQSETPVYSGQFTPHPASALSDDEPKATAADKTRYIFIYNDADGKEQREDITEKINRPGGWQNPVPGRVIQVNTEGKTEYTYSGNMNFGVHQVVRGKEVINFTADAITKPGNPQAVTERERNVTTQLRGTVLRWKDDKLEQVPGYNDKVLILLNGKKITSESHLRSELAKVDGPVHKTVGASEEVTKEYGRNYGMNDIEGVIILRTGAVSDRPAPSADNLVARMLAQPEKPLFIVDGVRTSYETVAAIDPGDYTNASAVTGTGAVERYGEEARHGALILTTKASGNSQRVLALSEMRHQKDQPLYILDGVRMSAEEIDGLNMDDIKSITVLKEGAAQAQYGEEGKNGVLVISTKESKEADALREAVRPAITIDEKKLPLKEDFPVFVVDGRIITPQEMNLPSNRIRINGLKSEDIKSITVLKGRAGYEQYGEAGQNGAIVIETKKKDEQN